MGLLGYLEQRGKGIAEGRLAAAMHCGGVDDPFIVSTRPATGAQSLEG
jgi:hypothetical protein